MNTWSWEWCAAASIAAEARTRDNWLRSGKTFQAAGEAVDAAATFMKVCADNDFLIAIRLIQLES